MATTAESYAVFVCLIASMSPDGTPRVRVCRASNLALGLLRHNRDKKCTDQDTKAGAPNWDYVMAIGPLARGHGALAKEWRSGHVEQKCDVELLVERGVRLGSDLSRTQGRNCLYFNS